MTREQLAELLERATCALADIASADTPADLGKRKAKRIYDEIRAVWEGPGPDDDATGETT